MLVFSHIPFFTKKVFPTETFMDKTKPVVMERHEFDKRDESKLKALSETLENQDNNTKSK